MHSLSMWHHQHPEASNRGNPSNHWTKILLRAATRLCVRSCLPLILCQLHCVGNFRYLKPAFHSWSLYSKHISDIYFTYLKFLSFQVVRYSILHTVFLIVSYSLLFFLNHFFLKLYFIDYAITVVPIFPLTPLHPAPLTPSGNPHTIAHVHGSHV